MAEKGLFPSREKAKAAIMAGVVYVDGIRADKPGTPVGPDADFKLKENVCPYVSRGGMKLKKALKEFSVETEGSVCMDIGASTGGFTDCLLQNGALRVYAVDVGYGQFDWKLRNDSRVVLMEKTNIRFFETEGFKEYFDIITIDVSFISLKLVFPVAAEMIKPEGSVICLAKPQFEAGREQVGKKGIVRDAEVHKEVIANVIRYGSDNGMHNCGVTPSPITGAKGNTEYLLIFKKI